MKRATIYTLGLLLGLLLAGCDSENAWDIFKTRGSHKVEVRELPAFTGIAVYNGINVVLKKGDTNSATLDGWENLLPKLYLTVDEKGVLTMEDKNKSHFVRDLDNMTTVYLTYSGDMGYIYLKGDGKITSADEVMQQPNISIIAEDASGIIDLNVKSASISIGTDHRNVADVNLTGECSDYLAIANWGNGHMKLHTTPTSSVSIMHQGTGNIYVNVKETLTAELFSIGDVYYRGTPTLNVTRKGKGNVIAVRD